MMSFKIWLSEEEGSVVVESRKPKPKLRPNNAIDAFDKEVEAIKADLEKYRDKKKKEKTDGKPVKPPDKSKDTDSGAKLPSPGAKADEKLMRFARIAVANLRRSPTFYNSRSNQADLGNPPGKKDSVAATSVSEDDARKLSKQVGIDFEQKDNKFTFKDFQRGVQFELSRDFPRAPALRPPPM